MIIDKAIGFILISKDVIANSFYCDISIRGKYFRLFANMHRGIVSNFDQFGEKLWFPKTKKFLKIKEFLQKIVVKIRKICASCKVDYFRHKARLSVYYEHNLSWL